MAVQDDRRENEMIGLFGLRKPADASRGGLDAELELDDVVVPFELKSTTTGSVTTVRDFGQDHILKWHGKHWLIGVYELDGVTLRYSLYGSPQRMAGWIGEKGDYVAADYKLAEEVPSLIGFETLDAVLGHKDLYTLADAEKLHKKQYTKAQYAQAMDELGGYSRQRMLEILRERCAYLIARGATLNNPHIPESYFDGWEQITANHAARLRALVREELASASATEQATE